MDKAFSETLEVFKEGFLVALSLGIFVLILLGPMLLFPNSLLSLIGVPVVLIFMFLIVYLGSRKKYQEEAEKRK